MKYIIFNKKTDDLNRMLLDLEKPITYPFGSSDRFSISHGTNYFQFFQRLGTPYWAAAMDSKNKLCAHLCGILRKVPTSSGTFQRAWYLCDLKKDVQYRSANTLSNLFRTLFRLIWKCQRGYAISMNRSDNANPLHSIVKKSIFLPFLYSTQLSIFSCSYEELLTFLPIIEKYRGPISYLNLEGIKDIILQKTGPLPLLHLQFGPLKAQPPSQLKPTPNYTYMWCSPTSDPLTLALGQANCLPSATATIFSFRMKRHNWSWVLTSEI